MAKAHETNVESQFGPQAQAYVASSVHSSGEDLEALRHMAAQVRPSRAIDLGTGGGHVAYLLADHAANVTAVDLSAEMLAAVAQTAAKRGLGNIETVQAAAEALPFAPGHFDMLACRYSAHHWADFAGGLRQARRVLATDAPAVFIDVVAPGAALLDTHLQAVELLRDTSHVRDYTLAQWLSALGQAGFAAQSSRIFRVRMDFPVWIERMRTPPGLVDAIRALQNAAPKPVREHFAIEPDGSFLLDVALIEARAL
ncbi:class I SAM-dependent methyltransferase [Aureimonas fodinaquatilis]|uniref:Class I SAM-dependent methyltransferase n=1 Tax=Aureimonas fodinaquatilis TaxID=2565783 RepID=A0A5B0E2M5_9HYPH|nr:class I SAM-dependent methyltransferase [Aureimonas fodinaquatilis]KAA0971679.1 class I SAM-dependent methyltransferase [Aureimonas fodinaquatilis]